jgi:hypothetical protein
MRVEIEYDDACKSIFNKSEIVVVNAITNKAIFDGDDIEGKRNREDTNLEGIKSIKIIM